MKVEMVEEERQHETGQSKKTLKGMHEKQIPTTTSIEQTKLLL